MSRNLGHLRSLGFARNPQRFLASYPDTFKLAGATIRVIRDVDEAKAALSSPSLRFFKPEPLMPWLGQKSPLWENWGASSQSHNLLKVLILRGGEAKISVAGAPLCFELVSFVREALVTWAVNAILTNNRGPAAWPPSNSPSLQKTSKKAVRAAMRWLAAADTIALVVPAWRRFSKPWRDVTASRVDLLSALGLSDKMVWEQDTSLTFIAGVADTPAIATATAALPYYSGTPTQRVFYTDGEFGHKSAVRCAIEDAPPIPMIFRDVVADCEFGKAGESLGIDTRETGLYFGHGVHACIGRKLAYEAAESALLDLFKRGYNAKTDTVKRRRVRLSYGVSELWVSKA